MMVAGYCAVLLIANLSICSTNSSTAGLVEDQRRATGAAPRDATPEPNADARTDNPEVIRAALAHDYHGYLKRRGTALQSRSLRWRIGKAQRHV
jgi:hypothetical protein